MKWLKSSTQKSWVINGKRIPTTLDGDSEFLQVTDEEYVLMQKKAIFNSLCDTGAIIVLDQEPEAVKNSFPHLHESNAALVTENTQLKDKVSKLEEQLAQKPIDVEQIKADAVKDLQNEAIKELQDKQAELDQANAKLAAAQKELDVLKKKAK